MRQQTRIDTSLLYFAVCIPDKTSQLWSFRKKREGWGPGREGEGTYFLPEKVGSLPLPIPGLERSGALSYCQDSARADLEDEDLLLASGLGVKIDEDVLALRAGAAHFIAEHLVLSA